MGRYLYKKNIVGIGVFIISMSIFTACGKIENVDETMGDWTEAKTTQQIQEKETTSVIEEIETETFIGKDEDKKFVGYYEYPTEEGMKAKELEKACRIEQEILDSMDTDQLAQAVVDYPLLINVFAYSGPKSSLSDAFEKECDAYRELLTRTGAKIALQAKIVDLKNSDDERKLYKIEAIEEILGVGKSVEEVARDNFYKDINKEFGR